MNIKELHVTPTLVRWECGCIGFRTGAAYENGCPIGLVVKRCDDRDGPILPTTISVGQRVRGVWEEKSWEPLDPSLMGDFIIDLNMVSAEAAIGAKARRIVRASLRLDREGANV